MKLRYTSLQVDAGSAEEHLPHDDVPPAPARPGRHAGGRRQPAQPGRRRRSPCCARCGPSGGSRYVMTDGAALPIALSDLVVDLGDRGWLAGTITAGHAFGGDLEAVSVPSALLLAVDGARADLVIVAHGPRRRRHRHAARHHRDRDGRHRLRRPATRGPADHDRPGERCRRPRAPPGHQPSHPHLARAGADARRRRAADRAGRRGRIARPAPGARRRSRRSDVGAVLAAADLRVTTMGRGPEDDPLFFRSVAAATLLAARRTTEDGTLCAE